ncbi:MAG: hypothetical protein OEL20_04910 [Sulfuritalea sp.]|nr:hypothetical protein [Sulfuritalea sp.]
METLHILRIGLTPRREICRGAGAAKLLRNCLHRFRMIGGMDQSNHIVQQFSPGQLQQMLATAAARLLSDDIAGPLGVFKVTGRLGSAGVKRGQWVRGVPLTDDSGVIPLDIPTALASARKLAPGCPVTVSGTLDVRAVRSGVLEIRMVVSDVVPLNEDQVAPAVSVMDAGVMTVEAMKQLHLHRQPFPVPQGRPLRLVLIHSSSLHAQVTMDCRGELDKLGRAIEILPVPTNITQAVAVANAIKQARGDIVMVIRGGGDVGEFAVFDDPRVVTALANNTAYRVVGLGHSGNRTLLDLVADFSARTPAQAGLHVREEVERRIQQWKQQRTVEQKAAPPPSSFALAPAASLSRVPRLAWAAAGALLFATMLVLFRGWP